MISIRSVKNKFLWRSRCSDEIRVGGTVHVLERVGGAVEFLESGTFGVDLEFNITEAWKFLSNIFLEMSVHILGASSSGTGSLDGGVW